MPYVGNELTPGGYRFDEVASALQKSIRRGLERDALYWAAELEPAFHAYLWKRLITIANEDIGPANHLAIVVVHALREQYTEFRKEGRSGTRMMLANAILCLARSPKSRLADHFQIAVYRSAERIEIPDYALDKHTAAGRARGRGFDHFEGVAMELDNEALPDPYKAEAFANLRAGREPKYANLHGKDARNRGQSRLV